MENKGIFSEVGCLQTAVLHAPDLSHGLLVPANVHGGRDYLLMDDFLFLPLAEREHKELSEVIGVGAQIYDFTALLSEILGREEARESLLREVGRMEELSVSDLAALQELNNRSGNMALAQTLITGMMGGSRQGRKLMSPSPNLIFARDIGAVVGRAVVLSYAASFSDLNRPRPRGREMLMMRHVLRSHPLFSGYEVVDINDHRVEEKELSIEGGDLMVLNSRMVLVGVSERTNDEAVDRLAPHLFRQGFNLVLKVHLPKSRGSMHLDTVFTPLSVEECVVFKEIACNGLAIDILTPGGSFRTHEGNLLNVLKGEGAEFRHYLCGGGDPINALREQWTDGANMLALAPGVVVSYDRNPCTCGVLRDQGGYEVLTAQEFLERRNDFLPFGEKKTVVCISSAELSRGRGGPRCLTFPLSRAAT